LNKVHSFIHFICFQLLIFGIQRWHSQHFAFQFVLVSASVWCSCIWFQLLALKYYFQQSAIVWFQWTSFSIQERFPFSFGVLTVWSFLVPICDFIVLRSFVFSICFISRLPSPLVSQYVSIPEHWKMSKFPNFQIPWMTSLFAKGKLT